MNKGWVMAQAVKCLLYTREDLSLIPPEPTQLCQAQWHGLVIPVLGWWIQVHPWGLCSQSSLLGEYQAKVSLVSKTKVTDISQLSLSTNAYTYMDGHTKERQDKYKKTQR